MTPEPDKGLSDRMLEQIAHNLCSLHDFDPAWVVGQERFARAVITEYQRAAVSALVAGGQGSSAKADTHRAEEGAGVEDQTAAWARALYDSNQFYSHDDPDEGWDSMAPNDGGIRDLHRDMALAAQKVWDDAAPDATGSDNMDGDEAVADSGVQTYGAPHQPWCQPGDQTDRAFRLRFDDPDMREMVFTGSGAEAEALAAYNQYAPAWNVYLFSGHPRLSPSDQARKLETAVGLLAQARPFVADDTEATVDIADQIDAFLASLSPDAGREGGEK